MSSVSLECYQLVQITLRLLPPYCIVCFCSALLALRTHVGFAKTGFDRLALLLTNDVTYMRGFELDYAQILLVTLILYLLFLLGCILGLKIFLQLAGLSRPACLFMFYPSYRSDKLRKKKATSDTAKFIHTVGCIFFVASLILGLAICSISRREFTKEKAAGLERSIVKAMLEFKLRPWHGVNTSLMLDNVQSRFKCCGLNSYHDFTLEPRPQTVTWEQYFYQRVANGSDADWKYPQSCCIDTDSGVTHNCSSVDQLQRIGCYARVVQYWRWRQAGAEHLSFSIAGCIAVMGSMAYWTLAM